MKAAAQTVENELVSLRNPEKAVILQRFFKTGEGQYGEGDVFLGLMNPVTRAQAKKHAMLPMRETVRLLKSRYHEVRLCALLIWVRQYDKGTPEVRQRIFTHYLKNATYVNNWDLVDLSAPNIVGRHLLGQPRDILYDLAESPLLWEQRIAVIATLTFIRHGEFDDTLKLAERVLTHPHDLIHKAAGWALREVGKRDRPLLTQFIEQHKRRMPRTMLRYAIEQYPDAERKAFLKEGVRTSPPMRPTVISQKRKKLSYPDFPLDIPSERV